MRWPSDWDLDEGSGKHLGPVLCYLSFGVNETTGGNVLSYSYLVMPGGQMCMNLKYCLYGMTFGNLTKKKDCP